MDDAADFAREQEEAPLAPAYLQPGVIWSCWREADGLAVDHLLPPADASFRWVHLDLSDRRSLRWVRGEAALPAELAAIFTESDDQPRAIVWRGSIGLVLPDLERDFDSVETGRIGQLRIVVRPGLLITGRYRPLATPDQMRARLDTGNPADAASALDLALTALADTIDERTDRILSELLALEDQILADEDTPDTRALVAMRRLSARLHRMAGGSRAAVHRIEADPTLTPALRETLQRASHRLLGLEREIVGAQAQLRLLREELDLQAGQRTNENVYLLSIVTALFVPATLVTGFFGMNTGGMPFERGAGGTVLAALMALACSGATWLILRRLGLVRR